MNYYKNKVVLITGASQGLGFQMANDLIEQITTLIIVDLIEPQLNSDKVIFFQCDLSNLSSVKNLCIEISNNYYPDIVILNAGKTGIYPISEENFEVHKSIFNINYFSPMYISSFFLDLAKKTQRKIHLVAISSIGVFRGMPKVSPYFCSKSALSVFFESLRIETNNLPIIATTIVHPGFIQTKMATGELIKHSFVTSVQKSSQIILTGISKKEKQINFPFAMRVLTFINRLLPIFIFDKIIKSTTHDRQ